MGFIFLEIWEIMYDFIMGSIWLGVKLILMYGGEEKWEWRDWSELLGNECECKGNGDDKWI